MERDLSKDLLIRFWSKVSVQDGEACWPWIASVDSHGYGAFRVAGFRASAASRISYIIANGDILNGKLVCHKCDNPRCVRPDHLFLGTKRDNIFDWYSKGNAPVGAVATRGTDHHNAKLDKEKVIEIRHRHSCGASKRSLARAFGVHKETINQVLNRETWAHVPIPPVPEVKEPQ